LVSDARGWADKFERARDWREISYGIRSASRGALESMGPKGPLHSKTGGLRRTTEAFRLCTQKDRKSLAKH